MGTLKYYYKNRENILKDRRLYYIENKDTIIKRVKESNIASYFPNLSKEEALKTYYKLIKSQNNLCAICNRPETKKQKGKIRALAIDHCHKTQKVRGLLCFDCNTTLGKVERYYNKIVEYLKDDM